MSEQMKPDAFEVVVIEEIARYGYGANVNRILAAHRAELAAVKAERDGYIKECHAKEIARLRAELARLTELVPCPKCGGAGWNWPDPAEGEPEREVCPDCVDGTVRVAKGQSELEHLRRENVGLHEDKGELSLMVNGLDIANAALVAQVAELRDVAARLLKALPACRGQMVTKGGERYSEACRGICVDCPIPLQECATRLENELAALLARAGEQKED